MTEEIDDLAAEYINFMKTRIKENSDAKKFLNQFVEISGLDEDTAINYILYKHLNEE